VAPAAPRGFDIRHLRHTERLAGTIRARKGVKATPMAMIALGMLGPSMALIVDAASRPTRS